MLQFYLFSQYIRWRLIEPIKRFFTTPLPLPPPPPPPPSLHTFTQHTLEEERVGVSNGRYSSKKIGKVLREGGQKVKIKGLAASSNYLLQDYIIVSRLR